MAYLKYTCANRHLFDIALIGKTTGGLFCPYCGVRAKERDGKYLMNFRFVGKPGEENIIDKSPLKGINKNMPDDIKL